MMMSDKEYIKIDNDNAEYYDAIKKAILNIALNICVSDKKIGDSFLNKLEDNLNDR